MSNAFNDPVATPDDLDKHHTKLAASPFKGDRPVGGKFTPQQEAGELGPAEQPSLASRVLSGAARVGHDVERSFDTGATRGTQALGELPGQIVRGVGRAASYVGDKPSARTFRSVGEKMRPGPVTSPVFGHTDQSYTPQTAPGRVAESVGELAPAAAIAGGPGGVLKYAAVPGVAGAGAKEAVENVPLLSQLKPYGDVIKTGTELAAGAGAGALRSGTEAVGNILRRSARGLDPAEANRVLDRADQIFDEAHAAGRPLTRAEAIYHASDGRIDMRMAQHLAEARGQPEVTRMVEQRGRQDIPAAARETQDILRSPAEAVAPRPGEVGPQQPIRRSAIGPELQTSTRRILGRTEQEINAQTEPLFRQAEPTRLPQRAMAQLEQDEVYQQSRDAVRDNARLRAGTNNAPVDTVAFQDQVLKHMREEQANEYAAGHKLAGNAIRDSANQLEQTLQQATGSSPRLAPVSGVGPVRPPTEGPYEAARGQQAELRAGRVNPFTQGPASKIYDAAKPSTKRMVDAVFDENADPREVGDYMRQITADNPRLAQEVVREHATRVFNQAMQDTQRGANPMAGGNIARDLAGTEGRRGVLEAAVRALPDGDARWQGMQRMLDYFRASASRIPGQSATAEKTAGLEEMKSGGPAGFVMKLPGSVRTKVEQWQLGHNLDQLGDLLTNPEAGMRFRQLMNEQPGSRRAAALVSRLVVLAGMNTRNRANPQ